MTSDSDLSGYLTVPEAAVRAGVSTSTVDRWRRAGILRWYRRGRRVFVRRGDIDGMYVRGSARDPQETE